MGTVSKIGLHLQRVVSFVAIWPDSFTKMGNGNAFSEDNKYSFIIINNFF